MRDDYFPPAAMLLAHLRVDKDGFHGPRKTLVSLSLLRQLVRAALKGLEFDQEWYLAQNPDVAAAWRATKIEDLHEHFVSSGYFEGRSSAPLDFDEQWYLATYEDVAAGIKTGVVGSALAHYLQIGEREGRAPSQKALEEVTRWMEALGKSPYPPGGR
jgi:hypothetical protein